MIQSNTYSALSQARFSQESFCYSWSTPAYSTDLCRLKQVKGPVMLTNRRRRRVWDLRILILRAARVLRAGAVRLGLRAPHPRRQGNPIS